MYSVTFSCYNRHNVHPKRRVKKKHIPSFVLAAEVKRKFSYFGEKKRRNQKEKLNKASEPIPKNIME